MKNKKILLGLIFLIALVVLAVVFRQVFFSQVNIPGEVIEVVEDESKMSPEEVIESLEPDDFFGDSVKLEIISPEEEVFLASQARMWQAKFSGIESDDSFRVDCHWRFYLIQNNEEILYEEMEKPSGVSQSKPEICGFTSTFISSRGKLRAELSTKVKNIYDEIVGEYTAEKTYQVN